MPNNIPLIKSPIDNIPDADLFLTGQANRAKGGYHTFTTIAERDNIHPDRRIIGMLCYVSSTNTVYKLKDGIDNSNWIIHQKGEFNDTDIQNSLNSKENLINKSTDVNLGTSDILYPTQKAVKSYVDNLLSIITNNILFIWKLFTGFSISELRLLTDLQISLVKTFNCNELGKEGKWYYDQNDTTSIDNTGTILVTQSGKRLKRIINDYIYPEWFGAIGNGINDDTIPIQNMLNLNYNSIFNFSKLYLVDNINIPNNKNILLNGSLIKKSINNDQNNYSYILKLNNNITISGIGSLDGNSDNIASLRTNTSALNYGISIEGDNINISKITIKNTINETINAINRNNININDVIEYNIGHGATYKFCSNINYNNYKQLNSNFKYTGVYQHCLDFWYCQNVLLDNILIKDVTSTSSAPSYAISGITILGCYNGKYTNITFQNNNSSVNEGLPIADDGSSNSIFNNIIIDKWKCGAGIEVQGGRNNKYTNILINNIDVSNTVSGTVGLHILDTGVMGGMLNTNTSTQQSRDRAISTNNTFSNIKIIGGYTGFRVSGSNNVFQNCQATGQSYGWRLQQLQGGVDTNYWNLPIEQNIYGNTFINCLGKNCLVTSVGYWGGESTFINFKSINSKSGFENQKRATLTCSSATANSIIATTTQTANIWAGFYIYVTTGNGFGEYHKILSHTIDTYTLDSNFNTIPVNQDEFVIIDKQSEIKIFGGEINDDQSWTLSGCGTSNYSGNISSLNTITISSGADRIDYNQKIKLKNIVTGSTSNDLICIVNGFDKDSTDRIILTPYQLGDGNPVSGNIQLPLVSGSGTITTSDYNVNSITNTSLTRIDGVTATLSKDIDGHFFIKIGNEYAQVMKKLDTNSYLLTSKLSTNYINSNFQIVKFDIEGIPSSQNGLYFNRHFGKVIIDNNLTINNQSVSNFNNYRSFEVFNGILNIQSGTVILNDFNFYKTNNITATTINNIQSTQLLNRKITIFINDSNTTFNFTTGNIKGLAVDRLMSNNDVIELIWNGTYWNANICNVDGLSIKNIFGDFTKNLASANFRGGVSGSALIDFERTSGVTQKYSITLPSGFALRDDTNSGNISFFTSASGSNNRIVLGNDRSTTSPRIGDLMSESVSTGAGVDITGSSLQISSGRGTGAATQSSIYFFTPDTTVSGSTQQSRSAKARLSGDGNFIVGNTGSNNGDKLQVDGNLNLRIAGNKIKIATGTNASCGFASLTSGSVIVPTNAVTSNSGIKLTVQETGSFNGRIRITSKIANTSFTITSSDITDNCLVYWEITN